MLFFVVYQPCQKPFRNLTGLVNLRMASFILFPGLPNHYEYYNYIPMKKISEIKVTYSSSKGEKPTVSGSHSAYEVLLPHWKKRTIELHEEFKVLLLNRANQALGVFHLSKGGVSGTVVDAKLIFSVALKCNASNIILAHNHPSGNQKPSSSDLSITRKIKQGCSLLDITLLDHLILTKDGFMSFADEGLL